MSPDEVFTYAVGMRTRFRGITERQGMVWRGSFGWAEWSPFLDYDDADAATWLAAAHESAEVGWPAPVRDRIGVNVTIPAVGPEAAYAMAATSGCRTAKIKVAEPGQSVPEDRERVAAVRDALGAGGRIRVDANGGWDVQTALEALTTLAAAAGPAGLEYAEQPCARVEELAELRVRLARQQMDVLIAADESIRRAEDPYRVVALAAADIAVLKVQPLGGVRACLVIAEQIGLPVVVSSALETSRGDPCRHRAGRCAAGTHLRLRTEHRRLVGRRSGRAAAAGDRRIVAGRGAERGSRAAPAVGCTRAGTRTVAQQTRAGRAPAG